MSPKYSKFLTFVFSIFPGCGQMYLGLIKRGLFIMAGFFACNYLAASLFHVFSFGSLLIWFYGFFDSQLCRKKLMEGKELSDDVDDIKRFLFKNRKIITSCFGLIFLIEILKFMRQALFESKFYVFFGNILICLLIFLGIYIVFFRKK